MARCGVWGLRCALSGLLLSGLLLGQRADRAIITGIVVDPNGSHVAGSSVTIRNESTGVETKLVSNDAGDYTSPPLVLGTYTVTVEQQGFKAFVRSGILLQGGEVVRADAALELGTVSERVEVSASGQMINVSQPDVSHTVD